MTHPSRAFEALGCLEHIYTLHSLHAFPDKPRLKVLWSLAPRSSSVGSEALGTTVPKQSLSEEVLKAISGDKTSGSTCCSSPKHCWNSTGSKGYLANKYAGGEPAVAGDCKGHRVGQRSVRERQVVLPLGLRQAPALGGRARGDHASFRLQRNCRVGIHRPKGPHVVAWEAEVPRLNHLCMHFPVRGRILVPLRRMRATRCPQQLSVQALYFGNAHAQAKPHLDAQEALSSQEVLQVASAAGCPEG